MTKILYVGAHDAVVVYLPDGGETKVARNELLDTTPEHAAALLDQPLNWKPAPRAPKTEKE